MILEQKAHLQRTQKVLHLPRKKLMLLNGKFLLFQCMTTFPLLDLVFNHGKDLSINFLYPLMKAK